MLNKLPPKVMERILGFLDAVDYEELACVSPRMWKIVEETPKKYSRVDGGVEFFGFSTDPDTISEVILDRIPRSHPQVMGMELSLTFKLHPPIVLIKGNQDEETRIIYTRYLRMFLANSTVQELHDPEFSFGSEFWFSLNMKVDLLSVMTLTTYTAAHQYFDHFRPTGFTCAHLFRIKGNFLFALQQGCSLLSDPLIYSMKKLHILSYIDAIGFMKRFRAKDLMIGLVGLGHDTKMAQQSIFEFLSSRIQKWVSDTEEIDKIQINTVDSNILSKDSIEFQIFLKALPFVYPRHLGWIDRTYDGMYLILRASDGQALIVYFDEDASISLIRCEYNFRRGRCLGSWERNGKALARISSLMGISSRLSAQNPELAENAMKKLKEECIKFNEYNRGATQMDLLTDAIWRPKGERRSIWRRNYYCLSVPIKYPVDIAIRHAYKYTKAFEERGELPGIDEFEPAVEEEILWKNHLLKFADR